MSLGPAHDPKARNPLITIRNIMSQTLKSFRKFAEFVIEQGLRCKRFVKFRTFSVALLRISLSFGRYIVNYFRSFFRRKYGGDMVVVASHPPAELSLVESIIPPVAREPYKQAFDIVVATAMLVFFAPLLFLAALLVRLESPGSVLFQYSRTLIQATWRLSRELRCRVMYAGCSMR